MHRARPGRGPEAAAARVTKSAESEPIKYQSSGWPGPGPAAPAMANLNVRVMSHCESPKPAAPGPLQGGPGPAPGSVRVKAAPGPAWARGPPVRGTVMVAPSWYHGHGTTARNPSRYCPLCRARGAACPTALQVPSVTPTIGLVCFGHGHAASDDGPCPAPKISKLNCTAALTEV